MSSKNKQTILTEEQKSIEYLKELHEGKFNICDICGQKGHFRSNCEEDEQWQQEVRDGCYIFYYCDYCGDEFMDDKICESHKKFCNYRNINK